MTNIALLGAGGKMGFRLSRNLRDSEFHVGHVEISDAGRRRLEDELNIDCVDQNQALADANVVILAVPDVLIGRISHDIDGKLAAGVMVMTLDPAAPFAGALPQRDDRTYFVSHPCHPPLFNDETTVEAKRDFFGGLHAKQNIVCALMQGPEESYELGERIARTIYAPVMRSHRVTVEQMAILEPALSETTAATCVTILREAMDEAVRRGVPKQAARDFLLGHLNIEIAILFEEFPGGVFSDAANKAIARAKDKIFRPDWKSVFEPEDVKQQIQDITRPDA